MYQFGIGGMFGRPTGGNLASPSGPQKFGVLQDVSVEIDQKLVELRGQNKFPDDIAPGDMTIKGKAAFGNVEVSIFNALYFGETQVTGINIVVQDEAASVPGVSTYIVTVAGAATFVNDMGVFYAATGAQLAQVTAGGEALGKYSVVETGGGKGVYTFAAADASAALLFNYIKTGATGVTLPVSNKLQGYGPIFELYLSQPYQGTNGMRLYACRASKMSAPMKRDGYLISDFEFQCYANAAKKVFDWYQISV